MLIVMSVLVMLIYMLKLQNFLEKILQILTYRLSFIQFNSALFSGKGATHLGSVLSVSLKYI